MPDVTNNSFTDSFNSRFIKNLHNINKMADLGFDHPAF